MGDRERNKEGCKQVNNQVDSEGGRISRLMLSVRRCEIDKNILKARNLYCAPTKTYQLEKSDFVNNYSSIMNTYSNTLQGSVIPESTRLARLVEQNTIGTERFAEYIRYNPPPPILPLPILANNAGRPQASTRECIPFRITSMVPPTNYGGSMYFQNYSYLTIPNNGKFDLSQSFTVEWYQYIDIVNQNKEIPLFSFGDTLLVRLYNRVFFITIENVTFNTSGYNNSLNPGKYSHIAFVFDTPGDEIRIYINGSYFYQTASTPIIVTGNTNNSYPLQIGKYISQQTIPVPLIGNIASFRWTAGALYTGDFIPSSIPLTQDVSTKLLLLANNTENLIVDASSYNTPVTNNTNTDNVGGNIINNSIVSWSSLTPFPYVFTV